MEMEAGIGVTQLEAKDGLWPKTLEGSPGGSAVKNPPAWQEMPVHPWVRRSPGGGHGNPLQHSFLGNPMDRGAWGQGAGCTVHGSQRVRHDLARKDGEGNGNPLQYSCLENPMGGGPWWAAVHGVSKSWTRLSAFTFTFHFHALEEEMATHSSVLTWRIPGMGEPGGLPSMG